MSDAIPRCNSCEHFRRDGASRYGSCMHAANLTQLNTDGELSPANVPALGSCYRHKPRRNPMSVSRTYLVRVYAEGDRLRLRAAIREHLFKFVGEDGALHEAAELAADDVLERQWDAWHNDFDGQFSHGAPPVDACHALVLEDQRVRAADGVARLASMCAELSSLHPGLQITAYGFPTSRGRGAADFTASPIIASCETGSNPDLVAPLFLNCGFAREVP